MNIVMKVTELIKLNALAIAMYLSFDVDYSLGVERRPKYNRFCILKLISDSVNTNERNSICRHDADFRQCLYL